MKTTCQICNKEFEYFQRSTITPKFCPKCESRKRIEKNKKILRQAAFYNTAGTNKAKAERYATNAPKRRKTPKNRFYSSAAWKWFSRYILVSTAIPDDYKVTKCSTCGKYMNVNSRTCHLGHYYKVFDANNSNFSLAFSETNVAAQCVQCNYYRGGREAEMLDFLTKKHGEKVIQEMNIKRKQATRVTDADLKDIAKIYRLKYKEFLQEKGIADLWKS